MANKVNVEERLAALKPGRLYWMKVLSLYSLLCFFLFGGTLAILVFREFHSYFLSAVVLALLYLGWWLHNWIDMRGISVARQNLEEIEVLVKDLEEERDSPTI